MSATTKLQPYESVFGQKAVANDNMFDYIVRLLVWAVEGENKESLHPVCSILCIRHIYLYHTRIFVFFSYL